MNQEIITLITLVVDDNPLFRKVIIEILSSNFPFMEIIEAGNAKEALQTFANRRPPLIFMDIRLPDMNGLEVTREIKKIDPGTAVIIVTNHDTAEYRDTAEEYGADDFISKTSSIAEEIERTVRSIPCVRDELGQNSRG